MLATEPRRERLSIIDLSVSKGDWRVIAQGLGATLLIALPIGYLTSFLTAPRIPAINVINTLIDIAQLVLFEELLFRAWIFRWLNSKMGLQQAAVLSAVIFGLAHFIKFDYPMVLMATWAGYILALAYHKTGRISTPMLLHAALVVIELFVLPGF